MSGSTFSTIGARLLHGRTITAEDRLIDAAVAVISDALAQHLFADRDAIGGRLTVSLEDGREQDVTVIRVTGNFASSQLTTTRPQLLLPLPDSSTAAQEARAGGAPDRAR